MAASVPEQDGCIIQPGYLAVSDSPARIGAVCGSCVVICVRDRVKKSGGVACCVYPRARRGEQPTNYHAETAVGALVESIAGKGKFTGNMEAFIFGGGHLDAGAAKRAERTLRAARRVLGEKGVKIAAEDVGGSIGRKILFDIFSGDVAVLKTRRIRKTDWVPELLLPDNLKRGR